ncbi:MAG: dehypoxanthine futalosine cyclase [Myxococcales bacterium]|nr:dehypoxanthine futalosine cyclase [Myxococcales bacterium]
MTYFDTIAQELRSGRRLDEGDALWLLNEAPLMPLGALAHEDRCRRHPADRVTFVIDANPNYTNVCDTYCSFCAFYRRPGHAEGYVHSPADLVERIAPAVARGATRVLLQGGHNPDLPFDYYLDLVRTLRAAYPDLELHVFSPSELRAISRFSGIPVRDVLQRFWRAGLRTIPGGGAEILSDRVRERISPLKGSPAEWLDVMRTAHQIGFRTTATMMYGHVETAEDVIEHLRRLRSLQDETGGFFAFIPWSFKRGETPLSSAVEQDATPGRYLRILAVSRLYLDNVPHVQCSWFSEGEKAGQLGLHFGADDFGGTLLEENVLRAAGHENATTAERVVRVIRDAGFTPVQRNTLYETIAVREAAPEGEVSHAIPA